MIELHQFSPINGYNLSPFCYKVEVYCQLANIPYTVVFSMPNKAPKGKLPFIVDDSRTIADSGFILDYLKETYGDTLDFSLSEEQKALGHLVRKVCEESLLFPILYSRWIDDVAWPKFQRLVFASLPSILQYIVPGILRRQLRKSLYAQGVGRHSRDEIYALGKADLKAIEFFIGKNTFIVSDHPTSYDAVVFAFLSTLVCLDIPSPLRDFIERSSKLKEYIARMETYLKSVKT